MATFSASVTATGKTSALVYAAFRGGDPAYQNYRRLALTMAGGGSTVQTAYLSQESAGADSTFSAAVTGLTPGTGYAWSAVLQYYDAAGWHDTAYTASGTVVTPPDTHVQVWIYNGGWRKAVPWVYNGGWKKAEPWVYSGGWKGGAG